MASRRLALRGARLLSLLSITWMTIEAGVAVVAAVATGSVALLGFGVDSLIELASAVVILWLSTGGRSGSEVAERRGLKLIAACFAALAIYLVLDAVGTLTGRSHPETSWP